jgi:Bacterial Ig-like domain (group 3)
MMRRSTFRQVAIGIATLSTVAGLAVGAVSSRAAVIGTFTVGPVSGDDATVLTLDTSGPCLTGTNFQVFVTGPGFPAAGYPVTASTADSALTANAADGYSVPLLASMKSFADAQTPPATLSGTYAFSGRCTNATGTTTFDTYEGSVVFTQNGASPATYVAEAVQVQFGYFTATALSGSPAGPVNAGDPITFTAHVSSSPTGGAIGTVQLMDGSTPVGSPTTIDSAGNAVVSSSFGGGSHTFTAAFTGKFAFITDSVSPPLDYTVNASPADATNTSLAISPASATPTDPLTLTAAVADVPHPGAHPVGAVQFSDGGVDVGSPVSVSAGGTATLNHTFAQGTHSFIARFTPTDATAFAPSASTSQAYTVSAGAGGSGTIETKVDPGSLTISVADASKVVLPSPVLSVTATFLTTSGAIHPVTVTDTRAGNPGWVLSGQVSDFTNTTGLTTTPINGDNLGWTPNVVDSNPSQTIVAGPVVLPASPVTVVDLPVGSARGLKTSRTLASAAAGHGTGTAHLGADLVLNVPTTVTAGTYEAVLTLTAI